jgi:hypothetical protein
MCDVDRDGQRFLMIEQEQDDEESRCGAQHVNLILNWLSELERLVPTG